MKNKTGYIAPFMVKTKMIQTDKDNIMKSEESTMFITCFKQEPMTKNYFYYIVDNSDVSLRDQSKS